MILIEDNTAFTALTEALNDTEERLLRADTLKTKTAVFDLDNTLLRGDIGDAVFARMLRRGYCPSMTWTEYKELQERDAPTAFKRVVSAMKGMSVLTVEEITRAALRDHAGEITMGTEVISAPRPHSGMRDFIRLLHWRGYRTLVVSASNQISVRLVAREVFGIPETDSFGIAQKTDAAGMLTGELIAPEPIWHGKVDLVRQILGNGSPLITAGDSPMDLPMLQLCDKLGFVIWAGSGSVSGSNISASFAASQQIVCLPNTTEHRRRDHPYPKSIEHR